MMAAHYLFCHLQQLRFGIVTQNLLYNLFSQKRMCFHNFKLFRRKPAGLIQDDIRNKYFSNIM